MQKQAAPHPFDGYHPFYKPSADQVPKEIREYVTPEACPKLLLKIHDPELLAIAGGTDDDQWHLASDYPGFKDINFKDITCTCKSKGPHQSTHDFESIFGYQPLSQEAILYRGCKRTILAAAKRQVKSAPNPNKDVVDSFLSFAKRKINQHMGHDLRHFGYSFNQWFNHLNRSKQARMALVHEYLTGQTIPGFESHKFEQYYTDLEHMPHKVAYGNGLSRAVLNLTHYEGICKVEIQETDGKPRMVCSIPDLIKYVMGPICWRLEEMAQDHLPVYCGGMNLSEMEDKINHYIDQGFDLVAQGDGSAFDNTQDVSLKALDRWIYQMIEPFVYHVPKELFHAVSQAAYKIMDVNMRDPLTRKVTTLMTYAVCGTVFSGDCDTTLMNTIRMGMYNWYTNEAMGLELGTHYVCWSKGDDFTVIYNRRLVTQKAVQAGYKRLWLSKPNAKASPCSELYDDRSHGLGQILKMLDFGGPDSFAFCSLNAWYTNLGSGHITLTRNVKKLFTLSNYSRKLKQMSNLSAAQYLVDQAEALTVSYGGIHIFDEAAQCLLRRAEMFRRAACEGKFRKRGTVDPRVTLTLEGHLMSSMYHITFRNKYRNILHNASYWETVKAYEMVKQNRLSRDELSLVNRQIDSIYLPGTLTRKLFQ
jgi:hypothetical protein